MTASDAMPPSASIADTVAPRIVAHRGNAAEFPENTLPALRSALELGVSYVEFDVQLSADAVPIVLHDATLQRTAGVEGAALDMCWSELERIPVHEPARFGDRFGDVNIPSLRQVLGLVGEFPTATAFVEIKRASLRKFGTEAVVTPVMEELHRSLAGLAQRCVVISFDLPALEFARRAGGVRIGWVLSNYDAAAESECRRVQPEFVFCDQEQTPPSPTRLWTGPWQWACYEVPHAARALELAAQGVTLVETMQVRQLASELRHG